jgi:DNA-binding protein HU-beta
MQKKEFIEKLSEKLESTKAEAEKNLNAVFELITEIMKKGEEFLMPGFGKFVTQHKSARKGRNPGTGEEINIPEKTIPVFKAASHLKEEVNVKTKNKDKQKK